MISLEDQVYDWSEGLREELFLVLWDRVSVTKQKQS